VLVLAGENGAVLAEHARKVERELRTIPGIGAVTTSASWCGPNSWCGLTLRVPPISRDFGAIADTLRVATAGDYDQGLAKLNLSQRQIPIVVKLPPDARQDLRLLERLPCPGKWPGDARNVAQLSIDGGRRRSTATTACVTSTSRSS